MENASNRMSDFRSSETGRSDLIQQWLKEVMILSVDEQNLDVLVFERFAAFDPGETSAEDYNSGGFHGKVSIRITKREQPHYGKRGKHVAFRDRSRDNTFSMAPLCS